MSLSFFQQFLTVLKDKIKPRILIFCSIYPNSLLAASIFINYCKMQKDWLYQVTFDDPVYFFSPTSRVPFISYDALLYIDLLPSSLITYPINFFHCITSLKIFVNNYKQQIFPKNNNNAASTSNISVVSSISIAEFIATALNKLDPNFIISGNILELWVGLSYYYLNYNSKESESLAKSVKTKLSSNNTIVFDEGYFQFPIGLASSLSSSLKSINKPLWSDEKQISQFLASHKIINANIEFNNLSVSDQNKLIEKVILRLNEENYDPFLYLQPLWRLQNQPKTSKFQYGFEIITFLTNFLRLGMPGKALEFLLSFPNYPYRELQDVHSNFLQKLVVFENIFITNNIKDRIAIDIINNSASTPNMDPNNIINVFRIGWMFNNLFPAIIIGNSYMSKNNISFPIIRINILHGSDIEKELSSLLKEHSHNFDIAWTIKSENELLLPYTSKELVDVLKTLPFEGSFYR